MLKAFSHGAYIFIKNPFICRLIISNKSNQCYNPHMNLQQLKEKNILLFGKSRAFSMDEFASQMKFHKIGIVNSYDESVALVVEGKMMTPYEQNASSALYEQKKDAAMFVSIDIFEKEVAQHIDANTLLMSLKLSRNKERLKSFIQNSMIDDALFFKLLKMYSWGGEEFFENDDNRDVSAAIILRFYKDIERNHNVQYATSGFMHLVSQTSDAELIETIVHLEPLQKSLLSHTKDANENILLAIASHPNTPKSVLELFVKKADAKIKKIVAQREDCSEAMQKALCELQDKEIFEALSYNKNLSKSVIDILLREKSFAKNIAKKVILNDTLFELLLQEELYEVAQNSSLSLQMQTKLLSLSQTWLSLASNSALDANTLEKLLQIASQEVLEALYQNSATPKEILEDAFQNGANHPSLASNPNTPKELLLALAESLDAQILKNLAQNPNTPVEVLYQLQLDAAFARIVKENPSFGKHIQQHNIGWLT